MSKKTGNAKAKVKSSAGRKSKMPAWLEGEAKSFRDPEYMRALIAAERAAESPEERRLRKKFNADPGVKALFEKSAKRYGLKTK